MRVDATACSYTSEMAAAGTYRPQRSAQVPVSFLEARSTPNTRSDAGNHYPRGHHPRMLLRNQPDVRLRAPGGIPERSKGLTVNQMATPSQVRILVPPLACVALPRLSACDPRAELGARPN